MDQQNDQNIKLLTRYEKTVEFYVSEKYIGDVMEKIYVILNIYKFSYYIQDKNDYGYQKLGDYEFCIKRPGRDNMSNFIYIHINFLCDDRITIRKEELKKVYEFIDTYDKPAVCYL